MKNRRRTCRAESPSVLVPHSEAHCSNTSASATRKRKLKCVKLWDRIIPSDLLQEILSRLGLKDNIRASLVCKTWCKPAVSLRKLQPRPWLFHGQKGGYYTLSDPSNSQTHKLSLPGLMKFNRYSYSRDGWLLVIKDCPLVLLLLNPFTRERIYLPEGSSYLSGDCLAFSAAPTSSSCLVVSFNKIDPSSSDIIVISTWRPGQTVWTTHRFKKELSHQIWNKCVYSNGMFYCLSNHGCIGVFDPSKKTWNVLPVKPSPADFVYTSFMTEHEGDIFVYAYSKVFKLNLKRNVWEAMRDLGGLTIFASLTLSLTRAGLSAKEKNRIYTPLKIINGFGIYYILGLYPPPLLNLDENDSFAWVDPPHKNVYL